MTAFRITLCLNCHERADVVDVEVGPEKGSQRDPYRTKLSLCPTCAEMLVTGNLEGLAMRCHSG